MKICTDKTWLNTFYLTDSYIVFTLKLESGQNFCTKGPFNNYVEEMRGGGGQKCLFLSMLRV